MIEALEGCGVIDKPIGSKPVISTMGITSAATSNQFSTCISPPVAPSGAGLRSCRHPAAARFPSGLSYQQTGGGAGGFREAF